MADRHRDAYSRAIAGYYPLTQAPSILHTALALHQAIWRKSEPHWQICGIPQIFYTESWQRLYLTPFRVGGGGSQERSDLVDG